MDSVKEWQPKTEEKSLQEEEQKAEKNSPSATNTHEDNNSFFTDNTLPKEEVIRGFEAFAKIFEASGKINCGLLRAFVSENKTNFKSPSVSIKAGFIVTKKKIRSSAKRNRIKRLLRESYRQEKTVITKSSVKNNFEILYSLSDSGYDEFANTGLTITKVRSDMNKLLIKIFGKNF